MSDAQAPSERRVAVVIEDDPDIRSLLATVLTQAGFEVHVAADGLAGVDAVRAHDPTVTTLDINLPGIDGFEVARRVRAFSSTYIVMLTARDDEVDTIVGLDVGADDYLTKPFRPRELRARIDAMLRRPRQSAAEGAPGAALSPTIDDVDASDWLSYDGLRLSPARRLVEVDGVRVELTRAEFDLLQCVLEHDRRVATKDTLALAIRPGAYAADDYVSEPDRRTVEVHMANVRRKLGDDAATPRWLETVRGVGYRLCT